MSFYHNSNETKPGYQAGRWIFYVLLVCCKACKFFLYLMHKRPHLTFVYPIRAIKWGALASGTAKSNSYQAKQFALHVYLALFVHFFAVTARLRNENTNFHVLSRTQTRLSFLSLSKPECGLQENWIGINATKFGKTRIHKSDGFRCSRFYLTASPSSAIT